MRSFVQPRVFILLAIMLVVTGCSGLPDRVRSARASFPLKYIYHPSYKTIGAMYKKSPSVAIELLERLCRKDGKNLAYRLTLADMYRDSGRANDAIRLWFEILALSQGRGGVDGRTLNVYFIPIVPHQKEEIRPYNKTIDKSLAYYNIGLIYGQNAFYEEAAEAFSKAAESARDPNRKAELYRQAAQSVGSKKMEYVVSDKDGKPYRKVGNRKVLADPMQYKKKEKAFYMMALALDIPNRELKEGIEEAYLAVDEEISRYEGRPSVRERGALPGPPVSEPSGPAETGSDPDVRQRALELFEQGEVRTAAERWAELYAEFPTKAFFIEVEMDCRVKSLKNTFAKLPDPGKVFILMRPYKGKECYQLCMGPYESREEADRDVAELETVLGGVRPRVRERGEDEGER